MSSVERFARGCGLGLALLAALECGAQPLCDALLRPAFHYDTDGLSLFVQDSSSTYGLGATASWSFGDGTAATADTNHQFDTAGTYTVCLTLTNTVGPECTATYCRQVVVPLNSCDGLLAAYFEHYGASTNTNTFVDMSVGSSEGGWLWEFGDGTSSTEMAPEHTWFLPGPHFVSLTRRVGACSATYGRWVAVDGNATTCGPPGLFTDFVVEQNGDVVSFSPSVIANGVIPAISVWSYGDGEVDTTATGEHQYLLPGTYQTCLLVGALTQPELETCFSMVCRTHEVVPVTSIAPSKIEQPSIWPNPADDLLWVRLPTASDRGSFRVMDLLGRELIVGWVATSEPSLIEVDKLEPGNYIIEVLVGRKRWSQTVAVMR